MSLLTLYRAVTKMLLEEKFNFHTYENKNYKPICVMTRYLQPTSDPEDIIAELRIKHQLPTEKVVNIIKRKDEKCLSLFMMTFKKEANTKEIFQLKFSRETGRRFLQKTIMYAIFNLKKL